MRNDPNCQLCKLSLTTSRVCVLGSGPSRAEVMIVGEAPGANEEKTGELFSGRSGQLLTRILEENGFNRSDVFICNAVSCRPPGNRTPKKGEIKACKKWLDYQIAMVKPKYVLLLGNVPLESVTGKKGITKMRGKPWEKDGIIWMAAYHPAFILRDETHEAVFSKDIKMFADVVDFGGIPEEKDLSYRTVATWADVKEMLKDLRNGVAFDIETNQLYPWQHAVYNEDTKKWELGQKPLIQSIGFGTARTQWCIPFYHPQSPWSKLELERIVEMIDDEVAKGDIDFFCHNGKFDMLWMRVHFGVEWEIAFDSMLSHFLLDENDFHSLKYLAMKYLGAPDWNVSLDEKKGVAEVTTWAKHAKYLAHDVYFTRKLRFFFGKMLADDPDVKRVFNKLLMPCANLFVEIEYNGVYIDQSKFEEAETFLRDQYNTALENLKEWEPEYWENAKGKKAPFNWGSTQQLAWLLFEELGIEPLDKTDAGNNSTSESVLKRLDHPCVGDLLKFREAKQQLSFFIDGWKPYLVNGRLHPSFKLHGTVTGRLSCENPNLQQVPRDKRIRTLVTAPEGWWLIEADLSQIELRIAAELANERTLINAFVTGQDPHWITAIREIARGGGLKDLVLETARTATQNKNLNYAESIKILLEIGADAAAEIDPSWKENRKKAKAINFGYLFGMWWKKFKLYARDNYGVNVTDKEAKDSRVFFFETYSDLPDWHKRQKRYVHKHGYVSSLSGRKRRLPAARYSDDSPERREAERQSINSPVQSFANDINLMTALQLRKEFSRKVLRLVGTVHDAILMEVRADYVEKVYKRVLEIMQRPELFDDFEIEMEVPIEAEAKIGPWAGGMSLEKWLKENRHVKQAA